MGPFVCPQAVSWSLCGALIVEGDGTRTELNERFCDALLVTTLADIDTRPKDKEPTTPMA